MTNDGLETCIINNQSLEEESGTSRGDEYPTDSLDDDAFSSCSSSKDVLESFSSKLLPRKICSDDWDFKTSSIHLYGKEKPGYALCFSDVEAMKERFSKLFLGEDVTGGCNGVQTALALSNAITHLAIPSKQDGENGRLLEIMTPKARADIHVNLPALRKLDSMLIETLDSVVNTEFWYSEVGHKAEGKNKITRESKRWWLPSPKVPEPGLSSSGRKKLVEKGNVVYQIFKAAKSINRNVFLEMPVPTIVKDALPKSGKTSLGDDLYKMLLASQSASVDEIFMSLSLVTERAALEIVNRLEAAIYAWKERRAEQASSGKSPVRASWSLVKDSISEISRFELLINRAERLNDQIKYKFSNLPQSFVDATKIQYGKDIGHAILEAYSRILANLAFRILSRIEEILQEDALSNPNISGSNEVVRTPESGQAHIHHEQSR
ncbi:unnamed protein product [Arabidopsis arenosa]|uniref:PRONE domain-containing protein n=1 Tax=Arabidopsis arenosa TaxID=38785 RepID=A0A8S2A738_ARAAE|nr:unnamed protein product [Arabidopsis arenosa]